MKILGAQTKISSNQEKLFSKREMEGKDGKNMHHLTQFMLEQVKMSQLNNFIEFKGAEEIPKDLVDQLAKGGRMVNFCFEKN